MNLEFARLLRCPVCSGALDAHEFESAPDGACRVGVLVCSQCRRWHPIADFVADLLPEGRAEPLARAQFFGAHRSRLEALGLRPPPAAAVDADFAAQEKQRRHFDEIAQRSDEFSYRALGELPFQRALRDLVFPGWRALLEPGSVILDIGCADGISTFDLAVPGVAAIGIDVSRELLLQGAARARRQGRTDICFVVADGDSIAVGDGVIDCVLCFGALHHVPDPARTLGEAERVLRDGGIYLGLENNTTPLRPVFDLLMRLRPLWREEAGAEAQIGDAELHDWTIGSRLKLRTRATVFVPPHLCNRIGLAASRRLLKRTDAIAGSSARSQELGGADRDRGQEVRSGGRSGGRLRVRRLRRLLPGGGREINRLQRRRARHVHSCKGPGTARSECEARRRSAPALVRRCRLRPGETDRMLEGRVGALAGVDVSEPMISAARARNPWAEYRVAEQGSPLPLPTAGFDVSFAICVLHHVELPRRTELLAEMARVTRPGGLVVIFEHNPLNPLTRRAVAGCEFDRDAVLLHRSESESLLAASGLTAVEGSYIVFFRRDSARLQRLARRLARLPLGAQYVVSARRP